MAMGKNGPGKYCLFLIVVLLLGALEAPADENSKAPFAAALLRDNFGHESYQSVIFGSLGWSLKGRRMKTQPSFLLSFVRPGEKPETVHIEPDSGGNFVLQVIPGECELQSVFSEGRWYRLGHVFSVDEGSVTYLGQLSVDCTADTLDYYEYRFSIDTALNQRVFNRPGSAWMTAIGRIPAKLKNAEAKMNIRVPNITSGILTLNREEKSLVKAAENGDMRTIEAFLAAKRPLDEPDKTQKTPLMAALQAKKTSIARRLLDSGAALELKDKDGWTPLMFALGFTETELALEIMDAGAELGSVSNTGWTPLHLAARYNQSEPAKRLLEKSADLQAKTNRGATPLSLALQYADEEMALSFLDHGAEGNAVESDGWTPLMTALRYGKPNAARRIIAAGADIQRVNNDGWNAFLIAIRNDQSPIALELIGKGADTAMANKDGLTPLYLAAKYGSMDLIEAILAKKVTLDPVTQDGWTPLHQALNAKRGDVAQLLIGKGADISKKTMNGWSPLHIALRNGLAEVSRLLIQKNIGLHEALPDGWSHSCWHYVTDRLRMPVF